MKELIIKLEMINMIFYLRLIFKIAISFSFIVLYINFFQIEETKKLSTINIIILFIMGGLIIASLINQNISILTVIVTFIILTISNFLYDYYHKNKIKVNIDKEKFIISETKNIYESLNNMRIKTIKKILNKYNL